MVYYNKIFEATPFPFNYAFVWSDEHLELFGEYIAKEYDYDDTQEHIKCIRDGIIGSSAVTYWRGNNFPAVVYIPLSYHMNNPYAGKSPWVSIMRSLSHELMHLAMNICEHIGYNPINEQEPVAYMMGTFMRNALLELPVTLPELYELTSNKQMQ